MRYLCGCETQPDRSYDGLWKMSSVPEMMRILQANMHRSRTANDLLGQIAVERDVDIVFISEQYARIHRGSWFEDATNTAALWLPGNRELPVKRHGSGCAYTYICTGNLTMMSCYLTPSDRLEQFKAKLDLIEDKIHEIGGPFIVAGDFNAKAIEWGEDITNTRGRCILDMAARLGLIVANLGNASTFRRPGCQYTTPDVTLVSESIAGLIRNWKVLEDYTGSDHQYIAFQISDGATPLQTPRIEGTRKWNIAKLEHETLLTHFDGPIAANTGDDANSLAGSMMQRIIRGCNASMPRIARQPRKRPVYWWTSEIAELRRVCLRNRRRYTRARRDGQALHEAEELRQSRKALKWAILRSKKAKWEELRRELNNNPWGPAYKIVTGKLGANPAAPHLDSETIKEIVENLFPLHPPLDEEVVADVGEMPPPFTEEELRAAAKSLKPNKAPGPDGVPAEVMKLLAERRPSALLNVYNACISQGVFPSMWKIQKLTLIPKGRGDPSQPSAYRPLCMLDSAGKLLEKLLQRRLASAIAMAGGLSDRQHGFRPGRSTLGALRDVVESVERAQARRYYPKRIIVLATLDVRNAFNSLRWRDVMKALRERFRTPAYIQRIVRDYLRNRRLLYNTPDGQRDMEITSGAAQGSILGPDIWNLTYDEILKVEMPEDTHLIGYADDIVAVISSRDIDDSRRKLNQVMIRTQMWLEDHGLQLARDKTEVILITRGHIPLEVNLQMGDVSLTTQKVVKYLGVRLDCRLTYWSQIHYVATKAAKLCGMLSRIMANIGGPTQSKRKLIMAVTNSVLLYGSEIWGDALRAKSKRNVLQSVQRTAALRVTSAYRTVSAAAVFVISGEIPIDLQARERREVFDAKVHNLNVNIAELRTRTMQRWQNRWNVDTNGRWTRKLIPNIERWTQRRFGEVNYFLTQFLSGHGYFRKYLQRMGKVADSRCIYCDEINDDAEHTFFNCAKWHPEKLALAEVIGDFNPGNIVCKMMETEHSWRAVARFVERILREKKRDLDALHQNETREDEPIA